MERKLSLTGIRGLAVLLVFTAHTPIRHIIGDFGQEAVYVFFFLSAYLLTISLEKQSISTYISKRFWRIYPLYFILIILIGLIGKFYIKDIILNLLFLQQINGHFIIDVSWSLIIEIQLYFLLPLIVWALRKYGIKMVVTIVFMSYFFRLSNIDLYIEHVQNGSMKVIFGNIIEVLDIFTIASFIAINRKKIKNFELLDCKLLQYIVLFLFITSPIILESIDVNRAVAIICVIIPLYTVLISLIFMFIIKNTRLINLIFNQKILTFYGEISYSFYLLHISILTLFKKLDVNILLQGGLAFICITFVSLLSYKFLEQKFIR